MFLHTDRFLTMLHKLQSKIESRMSQRDNSALRQCTSYRDAVVKKIRGW
jgi:hypothetical protein